MIQERKLQKELLYLLNKSTAQTVVSGFGDFVPRNHTNKTVFTDRREENGWERDRNDLI